MAIGLSLDLVLLLFGLDVDLAFTSQKLDLDSVTSIVLGLVFDLAMGALTTA